MNTLHRIGAGAVFALLLGSAWPAAASRRRSGNRSSRWPSMPATSAMSAA